MAVERVIENVYAFLQVFDVKGEISESAIVGIGESGRDIGKVASYGSIVPDEIIDAPVDGIIFVDHLFVGQTRTAHGLAMIMRIFVRGAGVTYGFWKDRRCLSIRSR